MDWKTRDYFPGASACVWDRDGRYLGLGELLTPYCRGSRSNPTPQLKAPDGRVLYAKDCFWAPEAEMLGEPYEQIPADVLERIKRDA